MSAHHVVVQVKAALVLRVVVAVDVQMAMLHAPHQAALPEALPLRVVVGAAQQADVRHRVNPSHRSLEITVKFNIS
jgi:hypothetical protein